MKNNIWVIIGGICGFFGVALGAFGAHSLKSDLTPEMLEIYKTGVFYQLIHSLAILAVGLLGNKNYSISALFFFIGILLFSGSLYLYSTTGTLFFAMITPVGGVSFLVGWAFIVLKAMKVKKEKSLNNT